MNCDSFSECYLGIGVVRWVWFNSRLPNVWALHMLMLFALTLYQYISWLVCPKERRRHDYIITVFITGMKQVHSITRKFVLPQSGSVFYKCTKLTGAHYKHRVMITLDGSHRVIFTLGDRITNSFKDCFSAFSKAYDKGTQCLIS